MDKEKLEFIINGMDMVYTFVMDSHDRYSSSRDYGNGEKMNMAEIHTLTLIADHPGITVIGVSEMWNRTLSAASQNINKLYKKNLVEKRKEKGNDKTIHLYATESGKQLSDMHKKFDEEELKGAAEELLACHSFDEIKKALEIVETGINILEKRK